LALAFSVSGGREELALQLVHLLRQVVEGRLEIRLRLLGLDLHDLAHRRLDLHAHLRRDLGG
jgi:hypothetical protein